MQHNHRVGYPTKFKFLFSVNSVHTHICRTGRKCSELGMLPVERPFEQKLPGGLWEAGSSFIGLQRLHHHIVQPCRPLLQCALLLKRHLEVCFQSLNHVVVTLAHPGSLLLGQVTDRKESSTQQRLTECQHRKPQWGHEPIMSTDNA